MNFFLYLIFLILIIFLINKLFKKNFFLISATGDKHQKFASSDKIPLSGGIFIYLALVYFYDKNLDIFFFSTFSILALGFFSDLKLIKSAIIRFIFQISLVIFFVIFNELKIIDTRIILLDELLENRLFNYLFVAFCVLILINGSNFIDGLNTLNVGYYILISLVIYYLKLDNLIVYQVVFVNYLLIILLIVFLINAFNQFYLGDSGSYVLGFIFSILLIEIYYQNSHLSPFFIILLLWYPCFETLFSIIRKNFIKKSPMLPDTNHLHQLIFLFIKKKYNLKLFHSNLISANIINLYNTLIFLIAVNYATNSQIQIFFILLNLFLYTVIYSKIRLKGSKN